MRKTNEYLSPLAGSMKHSIAILREGITKHITKLDNDEQECQQKTELALQKIHGLLIQCAGNYRQQVQEKVLQDKQSLHNMLADLAILEQNIQDASFDAYPHIEAITEEFRVVSQNSRLRGHFTYNGNELATTFISELINASRPPGAAPSASSAVSSSGDGNKANPDGNDSASSTTVANREGSNAINDENVGSGPAISVFPNAAPQPAPSGVQASSSSSSSSRPRGGKDTTTNSNNSSSSSAPSVVIDDEGGWAVRYSGGWQGGPRHMLEEEGLVATCTSENRWDTVVLGNAVLGSGVPTWWAVRLRVLQSPYGAFLGVAPKSIIPCMYEAQTRCGWYVSTQGTLLWSGPPHSARGAKAATPKTLGQGALIKLKMDTTLGAGKFLFSVVKGKWVEAFCKIPLDEPLFPVVLLSASGDSVELM